MSPSVCAIVVTYNRRALLAECLAALAAQERPPDAIVVVDNASTDGTPDWVRAEHPEAELLALTENGGGAGGFHAGMAHVRDRGHDWLWLMDDDTIATPSALAELLAQPPRLAAAGLPEPYLLASKAVWTDGSLHPMNAPGPDRKRIDLVVAAADLELLPLRSTTFVSCLISARAVAEYGLPHAHYFIWSDDIEYTARILAAETGHLVPTSVVVHKTKAAHTAVTDTGDRFYFHARNTLYMLRSRTWDRGEKLGLLYVLVTTSWQYLARNRFRPGPAKVVLRGLRDGLAPARA